MNGFEFRIDHKDADTRARVCTIVTPHGSISTPTLAPVGTQATVKSLTPEQIQATGTQLILANTYHLYLRPGAARIAAAGGIHKFSAIDLPIMTDSGGFQVFSLGSSIRDGVGKIANIFPGDRSRVPHNVQRTKTGNNVLVKVTDEEVVFRSHLDGSLHHFSPEKSLEVQSLIGADFVLTFDECTSPLDTYEYTRLSLERTHRWATRSVDAYHKFSSTNSQALQVVVQGGAYRDLRETSAQFCSQLPCFGYSIGGSLGRSKFDMLKVLEWTIPLLPESTPKHLLGIGEVTDIFDCVERGVDIFDCVIPTRWARNHTALVSPTTFEEFNSHRLVSERGDSNDLKYRVGMTNSALKDDYTPIDPLCTCYTCQRFTRAYINHLYRASELLAYSLVTIHNVHFFANLMTEIRKAIIDGTYATLKERYVRPRLT